MKQPLKHLQLGFSSLTYFVNVEKKKKQIRRNGLAVKFRNGEINRDATLSAIFGLLFFCCAVPATRVLMML